MGCVTLALLPRPFATLAGHGSRVGAGRPAGEGLIEKCLISSCVRCFCDTVLSSLLKSFKPSVYTGGC